MAVVILLLGLGADILAIYTGVEYVFPHLVVIGVCVALLEIACVYAGLETVNLAVTQANEELEWG